MSVRIRLRRVGRKKQPYWRVVVVPRGAPRDGAYIEEIGFYNPRTRPASLTLDLEKLDEWIQNGAEISDSVKSLARKARKGGDDDVVFTKPGEEAPRLKTAKKPERRPKSAATQADQAEDASEAATEAEVAGEPEETGAEVKAAVEPAEEAEAAPEPTEAQEEAETESEAVEASATEVAEPETESEDAASDEEPEAEAEAEAPGAESDEPAEDEAADEVKAEAEEEEAEAVSDEDEDEDEEEKD